MKRITAYILALSALVSCVKEKPAEENDGRIVFSASVGTATKAAVPEGTVTEGDRDRRRLPAYVLQLAGCRFGVSDEIRFF